MDFFPSFASILIYANIAASTLTVFPRVTDDNRRLWAHPEVVYGLHFELVWREGVCIVDVVPQPLGGGVLPLLPGVSPFPPHQVLQVGPVPLPVGERLETWPELIKVEMESFVNQDLSE